MTFEKRGSTVQELIQRTGMSPAFVTTSQVVYEAEVARQCGKP